MLRYNLICDNGHEFEAWFRDSTGFDDQAQSGLLSCAVCGSVHVSKAIMAPAVARRDRSLQISAHDAQEADQAAASVSTASNIAASHAAAKPASVALISDEEKTLRKAIKALRQHIEANAENVGTNFASTARQIHEGEIETKSIYGVATIDEISALHEDGIEAHALPTLAEEHH